MLKERLTTIEELEAKGPRVESIGVVKPLRVDDFAHVSNNKYEELVMKSRQTTLLGDKAIKLDIPKYKYQYVFRDDLSGRQHGLLCEDWELGELYRNCEKYRQAGKYKDEHEVHEKVRRKMLSIVCDSSYFVVGSHYRFPSFMVVGVVYPRKSDLHTRQQGQDEEQGVRKGVAAEMEDIRNGKSKVFDLGQVMENLGV